MTGLLWQAENLFCPLIHGTDRAVPVYHHKAAHDIGKDALNELIEIEEEMSAKTDEMLKISKAFLSSELIKKSKDPKILEMKKQMEEFVAQEEAKESSESVNEPDIPADQEGFFEDDVSIDVGDIDPESESEFFDDSRMPDEF